MSEPQSSTSMTLTWRMWCNVIARSMTSSTLWQVCRQGTENAVTGVFPHCLPLTSSRPCILSILFFPLCPCPRIQARKFCKEVQLWEVFLSVLEHLRSIIFMAHMVLWLTAPWLKGSLDDQQYSLYCAWDRKYEMYEILARSCKPALGKVQASIHFFFFACVQCSWWNRCKVVRAAANRTADVCTEFLLWPSATVIQVRIRTRRAHARNALCG